MTPISERTFAALLEAAPDAIVAVGADGCIILVNAQTESLFGYPRDELLGRSVEILLPESARPRHSLHRGSYFRRPVTRPMGTGTELVGRRRDGTEFPAEISLYAIDTEDGIIVSAAVRDVTGRKQAEAKFRGLLEAAPDAIVGVRPDGCIVLVNAQTEALFGYGREELLGQSMELLVPESERFIQPGHQESYFQHPLTRPMAAGMELVGRRRDGTEFPTEIYLSVLDTEDGIIVSAAVRDVTERRQAAIINSSTDAIITQTSAGMITSWNPAAERMYRYPSSRTVGRSIDMLLLPADIRREHELVERAYRGEAVPEYETCRVRGDGEKIDVACTLSPVADSHGSIIAVSSITRDITERIRAQEERQELEERLHQSQRLESLGQLAGGVAHDFNNLLAVILNYAGFVSQELDEGSTIRNDVEQIRAAAERAALLTRQLLIFGRRDTVEPKVLDLNLVVSDIQQLLTRTLGANICLSVHRSGDSTTVRADRGQLEQVLVNLAVNSRDAMPEGGVLSIETGVADFSAEAVRILHPDLCAGRYVRLCVSDTGVGMPPEVVARAYEPFFTTRPKGEGTGLGLATVYGIVTEAGGTVAISSRPNLGTMVEVLLPAESAPVSPALTMTTEPERVDGLGETVVVVEDETPIRQVISRILRQHHYTVIEASTGEQGFGLIDDDCRLLLTDVIMPAMSGPELAEKVRRTRPHIPILFMSGYSRGVLGPQWSSQEGVAVIQKPFASELLLGMVSDAIAKSSRCEVVGR